MIQVEEKTKPRGIQDLAVGRSDLLKFNPRDLRVEEGWNVRVSAFDPHDDEDLALAQSIAENGVRQPLTVYVKNGQPTLTDGHRRLAATLYAIDTLGAEIPSVPVQTEVRGADEAERVLSMETRNSGKQLQPIERAALYARLIGLGWDEKQVARRVGRSRQYVVNLLSLREGPTAVVKMVEAGEVSATQALKTLRETGDDEAATEKLVDAVATAKAAGKSRATGKHIEKPKARHPEYVVGLRRALEIVGAGGGVIEIEAEIGA